MTKSSGPRTEPWGTPQQDVYQEDRSVLHLTQKQRDDRYDLNGNQLRTEPWIPNQDERRVIKMLWSIVSNAAERSSKQRHDISVHYGAKRPPYYFLNKLVKMERKTTSPLPVTASLGLCEISTFPSHDMPSITAIRQRFCMG